MWRFYAFRLPDLEELHSDLPLQDVVLREDLSSPGFLEATLLNSEAYRHVRVGLLDVPVIEERGTLILASHSGSGVTVANIVSQVPEVQAEQSHVSILGAGFSTVMDQLPWLSAPYDGVEVDPLDVARLLLAEATGYQDSLAISINNVTSPVRIGEELRDVEFSTGGEDVSFEAGPRPRLARYRTPDIFKVFQDMTEETPHEWRERVTLPGSGAPSLHIDLGYPRIQGAATLPHTFEFGVDIVDYEIDDRIPYASEVYVTAGANHPHIQAHVTSAGRRRLRTVHVIEDKSLGSLRQATNRAESVMADIDAAYNILRHGGSDPAARFISSIEVTDEARPVSIGDLVEVKGYLAWGTHWQSSRVVGIERNLPSQTMKLDLQPWEID